ncbi:MAG: Y-family DNA polymerase [Spirochaetaceae bacterium]|jgi:DNA polymerase V|nr:Y-family DNA polymerase [Spirochaetaceae bacterium]
MILHVDGNSFYASCETVFRPDLAGRPVAVLTNNDGLIIALNSVCKSLGYKRGDVYHEIRKRARRDGVVIFSSNYTLYADMSARLNLIYNRFAPDVEFYSIDESFLYFPDWANADYSRLAHEIRDTVRQETGLPVSAGIAPNKTLAKLCNRRAKNSDGVCEWNKLNKDRVLQGIPVEAVWGIGRKKAAFLHFHGINTAFDLKNYPLKKAKKYLSAAGFDTVRELRGETAIARRESKAHKSIMVSRSFSSAVYDFEHIAGALAAHTEEAVRRLRHDKLAARIITVYLMTKSGGPADGQSYYNSASCQLDTPSSYTGEILSSAVSLLRGIYRPQLPYRKTMICLWALEKSSAVQRELFADNEKREKLQKLMRCYDEINSRYGRGTIRQATSIISAAKSRETEPWQMRRAFLSPCWTTNFAALPKVK